MIITNHTNDSVRVNQLYVITALMQNKNNCLSIYNDLIIVDTLNPISRMAIAHKHFYFDSQGLLEKIEEYEASEIQTYNDMLHYRNNSYDEESEDFEEWLYMQFTMSATES